MIQNWISIINVLSSVLIIIFVLLQNRGGGVSGIFGGDIESYHVKRGLDKLLFFGTIIFSILFVGSALARLIIG
jgi:protein translocase SecG subunit